MKIKTTKIFSLIKYFCQHQVLCNCKATSMQEELFTCDELNKIIREAADPIYLEPNLLHLGSKKLSINGVSSENGLILPYGNDWTGYKHIFERHSLSSRKPYWDEDGKIGNPTKFRLNLAPIEYLSVAAKIYKHENLNNSKNRKPELFDVYIGIFRHNDGLEVEYKLITYKETKVIHTFFVNDNKKPFNKKKVLDLRQGWANASQDYMNCIKTFEVPYFDTSDIKRFVVITRHLEISKKVKWYIQVNSIDGLPLITTFIKEFELTDDLPTPFQMTQLDFSNITWVEKIIKQILEGNYFPAMSLSVGN